MLCVIRCSFLPCVVSHPTLDVDAASTATPFSRLPPPKSRTRLPKSRSRCGRCDPLGRMWRIRYAESLIWADGSLIWADESLIRDADAAGVARMRDAIYRDFSTDAIYREIARMRAEGREPRWLRRSGCWTAPRRSTSRTSA